MAPGVIPPESSRLSEPVIRLNGVWKIFGNRVDEAVHAIAREGLTKPEVLERFQCVVGIADCSFEVPRGEIFCVMGLSGSGKSTMVRHINRLIEPTSGRIDVLGRDVLGLGKGELRELRAAHIGMVFQHMALFPTARCATTSRSRSRCRESRSRSAGKSPSGA